MTAPIAMREITITSNIKISGSSKVPLESIDLVAIRK